MRLTGHVDGISVQGRVARILDFKTGRKDSDYRQQALGYCALVLLNVPDVDEATCTVLWVRDQDAEHYRMTREQLGPWLEELRSKVLDWDGRWRPGNHCVYCPRSTECPARRALVRRDVEAFSDKMTVARVEDADVIATIPPNDLIKGLLMASRVELAAKRFRDAVRDHVMKHGEVTGDEYEAVIQHESRREIDTAAAWPVLESVLDDESMPKAIEIRISKLEELVAKAAGKGNGAAAKRELSKALEDAGAVKTTTTTKLVVRRA